MPDPTTDTGAKPNPHTTAFIGDSLTANGRWGEWISGTDVLNLGESGETTDALLERLDDIIALQPGTVVLLIGGNDLVWRHPVEHIVRNIEMVMHRVRRDVPDSLMLVQSVLPRERAFSSRIADINRHLWQFAPSVKARYLDLWPALAINDELNPDYTEDGVNLNDKGYEAWVSVLTPALHELHEAPPTTAVITLPGEEELRAYREGRFTQR